MKLLFASILLLAPTLPALAQDGSDNRYVKTSAVDANLVGQFVHLDFYRNSRFGKYTDTVTIVIAGTPITFREHRTDDGFNNWFGQQYLESVQKDAEKGTTRITQCRLDSITPTRFKVTLCIDKADKNGQVAKGGTKQAEYWFDRKDIAEVLVRSKQL
jgi:hypothetical protein